MSDKTRTQNQDEWKRTQIRIPQDQHNEIVDYAEKNNLSLNTAMLDLIDKGIKVSKDIHLSTIPEISQAFSQHVINQSREREELFKKLLPHTNIENAAYSDNENFIAVRYIESNTTNNCYNLIDYFKLPECIQIILFATSHEPINGFSRNDGPETNLPLMGALAIVELAQTTAYVIFDGLFLTAQRRPRYLEVREVLDTAINSNKAYFITQAAPFTSSWNPIDAVSQLKYLPTQHLTPESRGTFFSLLSDYPESEM